MPGIRPSQSAGRFHGMEESVFGATHPAKSDARARASNARSKGFLATFMGEIKGRADGMCNKFFGRSSRER
jgi:hypothetical protein